MSILKRIRSKFNSVKVSRRNLLLSLWAIGFLFPTIWGLWLLLGWPAAIVVSHETTRLTSPLTRDGGYIDYVQVIKDSRPQSTAKSWQTDDLGKFNVPGRGPGAIPLFVDPDVTFAKLMAEPDRSDLLDSGQPFSRDSHPELAENVEANRRWYELLMATNPGPSFVGFGATVPGSRLLSGDITLPMVSEHRRIVRRLNWLARYQFGCGQADEGLATCRKMLQVVERAVQLQCTMEVLCSYPSEEAAHQTLWHGILHHSSPDFEFLREVAEMPIDSQRHLVIAQMLDANERYFQLDYLLEGHRTGKYNWGKYFTPRFETIMNRILRNRTDWNATMQFANEMFDKIVDAFRHPSYSTRTEKLKAVFETEQQRLDQHAIKKYTDASSLGAMLADPTPFLCHELLKLIEGTPTGIAFAQLSKSIARATNTSRATNIAARLAAWRLETGEFPERLNEILRIEGFPDPPADLLQDAFADEPFHYSRTTEGFTMSSFGPNGVQDHSGEQDNQTAETDDQVWNWPPPKLPVIQPRAADERQ